MTDTIKTDDRALAALSDFNNHLNQLLRQVEENGWTVMFDARDGDFMSIISTGEVYVAKSVGSDAIKGCPDRVKFQSDAA